MGRAGAGAGAGTGGVGEFSGIPESPAIGSGKPRTLAVSSLFLGSNLLRSGVLFVLTVPPNMFSRATDVTAEALGGLGHDPYQLRARRTCEEQLDKIDEKNKL